MKYPLSLTQLHHAHHLPLTNFHYQTPTQLVLAKSKFDWSHLSHKTCSREFQKEQPAALSGVYCGASCKNKFYKTTLSGQG